MNWNLCQMHMKLLMNLEKVIATPVNDHYLNLKQKEQWIDQYLFYPEFIGVNMKKYKDKSHIDMSDGILIDDSVYMLETSNAQEKYCFGDIYSWNKDWTGKRLMNWTDIAHLLL